MAAFCDSSVDFLEDTEEDVESARLNRRHQELVRKLKNKKDTPCANQARGLCDPEKLVSIETCSQYLNMLSVKKTATSQTNTMNTPEPQNIITMENPEPQLQDNTSIIEESSLDQECGQHTSYKTEMFCKDCRVLVCALCFLFGDHKGHDGADIGETRWVKYSALISHF